MLSSKIKLHNALQIFSFYSEQKLVHSLPTLYKKYEPFRDDQSPIILDVEEERRKTNVNIDQPKIDNDMFNGISPHRGKRGVIDIEELVPLLQKENAQNIFVAKVPTEYNYVDHIVVVSAKSSRHMLGISDFIRKVYKFKVNAGGYIPMIEGKNSSEWIALDLGNIALHVFSDKKREEYDLESLWGLGPTFDKLCNIPEEPLYNESL